MSAKQSKKKSGALGRGLGNLLESAQTLEKPAAKNTEGVVQIELSKIKPNPDNPRKKFDQTAIKELASTIEKFGLLQPILVQQSGDGYVVISGERRLRACRFLKQDKIPVLIKQVDSKENIEISLIENIQREQLDAIEEGEVYKKLIEQYSMTQEELSGRVGKNRSTIANRIRLLQLPVNIKAALADNRLTEGQVRPLLTIENDNLQNKLAAEILKNQLTARQVEELARNYRGPVNSSNAKKTPKKNNKEADKLAREMGEYLQTRVFIKHNDKTKSGSITIDYFNLEDLDRILNAIGMDKKGL